jgi:hypothetical protein
MLGDVQAGELRSSMGATGLALLRIEHVTPGRIFQCGAVSLKATLPQWVTAPPDMLAGE